MKDNALGLNLAVFNIYFVATQDNGNVLTNTHQIAMPVGYVLIGNSRSDVKHDDGTLSCWRSTLAFNTKALLKHTSILKGVLGKAP